MEIQIEAGPFASSEHDQVLSRGATLPIFTSGFATLIIIDKLTVIRLNRP
jgi:hypothetical protein